MREERVLERVMEASLAAQCFGQEIWLWHVSMVSDEHPNGTTGVDYQHLRFIRSEAEFHFVESLAFALADWYPGILRKWPNANGALAAQRSSATLSFLFIRSADARWIRS